MDLVEWNVTGIAVVPIMLHVRPGNILVGFDQGNDDMLAPLWTVTVRLRILSLTLLAFLVTGAAKLPAQQLAPVVTPDAIEAEQDFNALRGSDLLDLTSTENSTRHVSYPGTSSKTKSSHDSKRFGAYVDWLYLRPGNSDIVYAVEVTGPDPINDSPTGPAGINQMGFNSGFRVGGFFNVGDCSRLDINYTWYQTDDQDTIQAAAGTILELQVAHPSRATTGVGSAMATADQDLTMQLIDIDYQDLILQSCYGSIGYRVGLRYGHLEQGFMAQQNIFAGAGLTTVATDIDYEGFGIRMGLDYERVAESSGFLLYAKGTASFLAGELNADYRQTNQFGGAAVIGNNFRDYRILSILDAEAGIGWQNCSGRYRVTAGYVFSGWFNALTNGAYIEAVQTATNQVQRPGTYNDVAETFTLSGLTVRGEFRF